FLAGKCRVGHAVRHGADGYLRDNVPANIAGRVRDIRLPGRADNRPIEERLTRVGGSDVLASATRPIGSTLGHAYRQVVDSLGGPPARLTKPAGGADIDVAADLLVQCAVGSLQPHGAGHGIVGEVAVELHLCVQRGLFHHGPHEGQPAVTVTLRRRNLLTVAIRVDLDGQANLLQVAGAVGTTGRLPGGLN